MGKWRLPEQYLEMHHSSLPSMGKESESYSKSPEHFTAGYIQALTDILEIDGRNPGSMAGLTHHMHGVIRCLEKHANSQALYLHYERERESE